MRQPIAITFPNMTPSAWIEEEINKRAARLDALCPGILSCHVVADIPHRHHQKGNLVKLSVTLRIRGDEVTVSRKGEPKDCKQVIRAAFDTARRRLLARNGLKRAVRRRTAATGKAVARRIASA